MTIVRTFLGYAGLSLTTAGLLVVGLHYYFEAQGTGVSDGLGVLLPRLLALWSQLGAAAPSSKDEAPGAAMALAKDAVLPGPTPMAVPTAPPAAALPAGLTVAVTAAPLASVAPQLQVPSSASPTLRVTSFPTPREQQASRKQLVEGHWYGMELLDLTPELARQYKVPPSVRGLLVDEVSLEAAEAGLLAGDIVTRVGALAVGTLADFHDATLSMRDELQAQIEVWREGQQLTLMLSPQHALGVAMFEAASPIPPGAVSPHKSLGQACTDCHIIMAAGGQLPIDAGDLLPAPPPITSGARPPHGDRGLCRACHRVVLDASAPP